MTKVSLTDNAPGPDKLDSDSEKPALHIVELGKARPGKIRALKNGEGPLIDEVAAALADIEKRLGAGLIGTTLLPVVVVVERRRKKKRGMFPMLGM